MQIAIQLIFSTAVFPHLCTNADQMGDVGNSFTFAPLIAMQRFCPEQCFSVSGSDRHFSSKKVLSIATSSFLLKLSSGGGGA